MLISMLRIRYSKQSLVIWGRKLLGSSNCCFSALNLGLGILFPFQDGWTALHKAIIGKKQAITNYLLRESANPFVLEKVSRNSSSSSSF
jgi:ankyrin repeat protein